MLEEQKRSRGLEKKWKVTAAAIGGGALLAVTGGLAAPAVPLAEQSDICVYVCGSISVFVYVCLCIHMYVLCMGVCPIMRACVSVPVRVSVSMWVSVRVTD